MVLIQATPAKPQKPQILKVAAYCRVSFLTERTEKSLTNQISHYQQLIKTTPGWQFAGVYVDRGVSAATTKNRDGFTQMLEKARNGEIDLILTKSISRFSRNTLDLLNTVRELREIGVEVRFEKERISTASKDGEFLLTLLASFAQAESEQQSENVRWAVEKRFKEGRANGFHLFGYTSSRDATDVEIVEEEARVVRWIYDQYLKQVSCEQMSETLRTHPVLQTSRHSLSPEGIRFILKNPAYTGRLLLGRERVPLGTRGRTKKNTGMFPRYLVEGAIPAIITDELFQQVQDEIKRRRKLGAIANRAIETSMLTSRLVCGVCGNRFLAHSDTLKSGLQVRDWSCKLNREGKKTCAARPYRETDILNAISGELGTDTVTEELLHTRINQIILYPNQLLTICWKDGSETSCEIELFNYKKACWDLPGVREEHGRKQRAAWTEERRKERSRSIKQKWQDPEFRRKVLEGRRQAALKRARKEGQA